jgi:tetratricopeptide (TPR) repeat protein
MNPILEAVFKGEYEAGYKLFKSNKRPSAEDMRWAGICLLNLDEALKAQDVLRQAQILGNKSARIELAAAYRKLDDQKKSDAIIQEIDSQDFNDFDLALLEREKAVSFFAIGQLKKSIEHLEQAWEHAIKAENGQYLLPGITLVLAYGHADLGQEERALHYIGITLEKANIAKQAQLKMIQALCYMYIERFDSAFESLAEADRLRLHAPAISACLRYFQAKLELARGHHPRALDMFAQAADIAAKSEELETEAYAALGAVFVKTTLGDSRRARSTLARGRALAKTPKARAHAKLREGALLAYRGVGGGVPFIEDALKIFRELGLERDAGVALLHLAEAHLSEGDKKAATKALEEAADVRSAFKHAGPMRYELRDLPQTMAFLRKQKASEYVTTLLQDFPEPEMMTVSGAARVRFQALGRAIMTLKGEPIKIKSSTPRAVHMITLLLKKGKVTLEEFLAEVFPDSSERNGRNQFHVTRYQLFDHIPGLEICFDKTSKAYILKLNNLHLECDWLELEDALEKREVHRALDLYQGTLLRDAEGEWARECRMNLEWSLIMVGLETVESYYNDGRFDLCIQLAQRLERVAPLDEALSGFLVRATHKLKGSLIAHEEWMRIDERYRLEVGSTPPVLTKLHRELKLAVN